MTFPNVLFEMQSKISLSAFILMGTFSYLGAMALEDKNLNISPSNSSYRTPEKLSNADLNTYPIGSAETTNSLSPQSPVPIRLGNNTREAIVRVNTSEFCVPKVVSVASEGLVGALSSPDKRSKMFGQRNLDRIKKLHAHVQKNVTAGSGARRKTVYQIHQTEPTSSTDSPLVTYSETYIRSPGNESPGYVHPSLNPYHMSYADEEVLSPSVRRDQENQLLQGSEILAENSVALRQRLNFDSDVSQELMRVRQEKEEFTAMLQTYFSGELDPSATQAFNTTETNKNLGYAKVYKDYIQGDEKKRRQILKSIKGKPEYIGLTEHNAQEFLHSKAIGGFQQVQEFFTQLLASQKKVAKIAKTQYAAGQELTVRASQMLEQSCSVMDKMEDTTSILYQKLNDLLYREELFQFMNDTHSGVVRKGSNLRDPRQFLQVVELMTNEFIKSSQMNLQLVQTSRSNSETINRMTLNSETQTETIERLSRMCDDFSNRNQSLTAEKNSLSENVLVLQMDKKLLLQENSSLVLAQEAYLSEIAELKKTIANLQQASSQKKSTHPFLKRK